jgi:hypothetical protein
VDRQVSAQHQEFWFLRDEMFAHIDNLPPTHAVIYNTLVTKKGTCTTQELEDALAAFRGPSGRVVKVVVHYLRQRLVPYNLKIIYMKDGNRNNKNGKYCLVSMDPINMDETPEALETAESLARKIRLG